MQNTPAKSHTKKRSKNLLRGLTTAGTVLGIIAAIVGILVGIFQLSGITRIQDLFIHPPPTPTSIPTPTPTPPLSIIAETTYDTVSPACDQSKDPLDIFWRLNPGKITCLPNDGGTNLVQTDPRLVATLLFEAVKGYELASNQTLSADFANIANNVCAGLQTRLDKKDRAGYAFYICGDGKWYILQYSREGGIPIVLAQSTSATQEKPSDHYSVVITVNNSNLQMVISGGQTHTVQNSDYTLTEAASINASEEAVLTTYQSAHFTASITVSHFHYEQA